MQGHENRLCVLNEGLFSAIAAVAHSCDPYEAGAAARIVANFAGESEVGIEMGIGCCERVAVSACGRERAPRHVMSDSAAITRAFFVHTKQKKKKKKKKIRIMTRSHPWSTWHGLSAANALRAPLQTRTTFSTSRMLCTAPWSLTNRLRSEKAAAVTTMTMPMMTAMAAGRRSMMLWWVQWGMRLKPRTRHRITSRVQDQLYVLVMPFFNAPVRRPLSMRQSG